jgi:hypothetical protein
MPDAGYGQERAVGRVVVVSNYRVNVLLDPDTRSQVRSFPHNISVITQVGGYLVFPVSPGVLAVGIIVGASEDEALEPDANGFMALQLARARRILRLNLLGQLKIDEPFIPGVSVYPTLDTPALLPTDEELAEILRFRPRPSEAGRDVQLVAGLSPVYGQQPVTASYNDLLARPLGVVGNTGSGKSWSAARLMQEALHKSESGGDPVKAKFIILDINGEYGKAFGVVQTDPKELNLAYVNGRRFVLPLWAFDLAESIAFFEASQASQVPVLERVITEIRENAVDAGPGTNLRRIVRLVDTCNTYLDTVVALLDGPTNTYCGDKLKKITSHLKAALGRLLTQPPEVGYLWPTSVSTTAPIDQFFVSVTDHDIPPDAVANLAPAFEKIREGLLEVRAYAVTTGGLLDVTADSPIPFDGKLLLSDEFFFSATARFRGQERMQEYLSTLRLRIHRQLADKRWAVFTSARGGGMKELVESLLAGDARVVVVDCSMLAHDVLPCFCAILGRILLDLRSRTDSGKRIHQPFVLVLEEAHNYLRPPRQDELWGTRLSRDAFERISKEGRKFGLSLIIASQRPSDVSATVLSQCANFLIHRIQNPEDIDYFKKILPLGSRDLLEQLPILAPGEGLLMGSAVNVPTRLRVQKPEPPPESETSRPWESWQGNQPEFDREEALARWVAEAAPPPPAVEEEPVAAADDAASAEDLVITDDDVPF